MNTETDILDLRSDKTLEFYTLEKGTLVYTISNKTNPGTTGPYYLNPAHAISGAFYSGLDTRTMIPTPAKTGVGLTMLSGPRALLTQPSGVRGNIATNYMFPNDMVLIEYVTDRKIIFTQKAVNGNLELRMFCQDNKPAAKLVPNISFFAYNMTVHRVFIDQMDNVPITDGKIVMNEAIARMISASSISLFEKANAYPPPYVDVQSTGFVICQPQEIFGKRYFYPVDWEKVWAYFIIGKSRLFDKDGFEKFLLLNLLDVIGGLESRTVLPPVKITPNIMMMLMKFLPSMKDFMAVASLNRYHRNAIYNNVDVQLLARHRYLPTLDNCYEYTALKVRVKDTMLLGLPRRPKGRKFWNVCPVILKDDLPKYGVSDDLVPGIVHIPARNLKELSMCCNSFMSMFAMHYSMTQWSNNPAVASILVKIGQLAAVNTVSAEKLMSAGEGYKSANMLLYKPVVKHEDSITGVSYCGSWMNDINIAPMFQHPSYIMALERLKNIELSAYEKKTHTEGMSQYLTLFRNGHPLIYIITTQDTVIGKYFSKSYERNPYAIRQVCFIYIDRSAIDQRTAKFIDSDEAMTSYANPNDMDNIKLTHTLNYVNFIPFGPFNSADNQIHQVYINFTSFSDHHPYYIMYMYLMTMLRVFVVNEGCDGATWSVNW